MLPGYGIQGIVKFYGVITLAVSVLFLVVICEKPPSTPCLAGNEYRMDALSGFKYIVKQPGMLLLLGLFFIGLGHVQDRNYKVNGAFNDRICAAFSRSNRNVHKTQRI